MDIYKKVADFQEKLKYLPTRLPFDEIGDNLSGFYDHQESTKPEHPTGQSLQAMIESVIEMEQLIKKSYLFTEEKIAQFNETNPVQRTLRETIEIMKLEMQEMQRKISLATQEASKGSGSYGDRMNDNSSQQITKLQGQVTQYMNKIEDLERDNSSLLAKT